MRTDLHRLVALLLVAAVLGAFMAQLAQTASAPYVGARLHGRTVVWVDAEGPAARIGVHAGETVTGIQPGYSGAEIRRADGAAWLEYRTHPLRVLALHGVHLFLAGLVWLAVGLLLVLRRTHDSVIWLAFLAQACFGAALLLDSAGVYRDLVSGPYDGSTQLLLRALGGGLLVQFIVLFALPDTEARGAWALTGWWAAGATWTFDRYLPLGADLVQLAPRLLALFVLMRAQVVEPVFTRRQQSGWLVTGVALLLLVDAATALARPELGPHIDGMASIALPLAIAFATLKLRLIDFERLVGRAATGAALAVPLGAGWWLAAGELAPLPAEHRALLSGATVVLAVLAFLALLRPAERRLLRWLRPHLSRRVDAFAAIEEAVLHADRLDALVARVTNGLGQALGARAVRLLINDGSGVLRVYDAAGPAGRRWVPPNGRLLLVLGGFGAPVFVSELLAQPVTAEEHALLADIGRGETEVLVPCRSRGVLVGILQLAAAPDGRAVDGLTYRLLAELALRLGPTLDPLCAMDRQARRERLVRDIEPLQRAQALEVVARDLGRRVRPAAVVLRHRANEDTDAADASQALESVLNDLAAVDTALAVEPFTLRGLFEDVDLILEPEMEAHQIAVAIRMPNATERVELRGDRRLVLVALLLVARNAIEALSDWEGPRQITFEAHDLPSEVQVRVRDTGPGLPLVGVDPRRPWFSGRDRDDALGLGLSVAERIARRHGGRLDLSTAPDSGLDVEIRLPLRPIG